jgi:2-C-methyl-D-erythritol 4-phosphate cytidylyltransferase
MERFAVIVAAGSGTRMGSAVPKQFLLLKGLPLLMHSIRRFSDHCQNIIVVLAEDRISEWGELCSQYKFDLKHQVIPGGALRAESVKAGLDALPPEGVVAIHDAARPLISGKLISTLYRYAEQEGSAVPVIPLSDSLRKVKGNTSQAVDRNEYRLVQTPQCFDLIMLRKAFLQPGFRNFTDEASLAEAAGYTVNLVEGENTNIKITLPADLLWAEQQEL